jgi:membrane associated rhomboid family serine protease
MIPLRDSVRSRSFPFVNLVLILANGLAFFRELSAPGPEALQEFIFAWGVVPARLLADPAAAWPTVFSSMFLHGGWAHIIGNMLYLWIFGDNVEDRMGRFRYLVFYLTAGTAATLTQVWLNPASQVPMVGASGAIAGVLGAYFVLYPRARVLTLVPLGFFSRVVEIPAYFFLGFWFVLQWVQGALTSRLVRGDVGGVAWWAHAGGFVGGVAMVWLFRRR